MIRKLKMNFIYNILITLFIFITLYLLLYKYLNKLSFKENLENITYLDIIHRLLTSHNQYKVEEKLKNFTQLGGNFGPVTINYN